MSYDEYQRIQDEIKALHVLIYGLKMDRRKLLDEDFLPRTHPKVIEINNKIDAKNLELDRRLQDLRILYG